MKELVMSSEASAAKAKPSGAERGDDTRRSLMDSDGLIRSPVVVKKRSRGRPTVRDLAIHLEGLANPTRLAILQILADGQEKRVSELAIQIHISQPRMSWHLRILRNAELVKTRVAGREVFCRLDGESISRHLQSLSEILSLGEKRP
jgi:DNA-binding transcriptional ArsR family regulator